MTRTICDFLAGMIVAGVVLASATSASATPNGSLLTQVGWMCHPAMQADPCDLPGDLADLASGDVVVPQEISEIDKPVDCFYVYPTASPQIALNADPVVGPDIEMVTKLQAARFASECRMFAPTYRQVPLPGVGAVMAGDRSPVETAYEDVLAAWHNYMATENAGRGVILLSHSQGTLMLRRLIREEIDANAGARSQLVGAFLLGGNVTTLHGSDRGGDFANIPICRQQGQNGCVVAYSSNILQPVVSGFGNSSLDLFSRAWGLPNGEQFQIACTDPAILSGDARPFGLIVPSRLPAGFMATALAMSTAPDGPPTSSSTWTAGRGRFVGHCVDVSGYNQYHVDAVVPQSINETPGNDTHLLDFNWGLDRLVSIAHQQVVTWLNDA